MYKEEEFLQLSGIQHFEFCRRQWALAYIEMQWKENVRTVEEFFMKMLMMQGLRKKEETH